MKDMENLEKVTLVLDMYNACRTNTARAYSSEKKHYNFPLLVHISGARFDDLLGDLSWCAENKADKEAIETIKHFAEALLSAYQIQRTTY